MKITDFQAKRVEYNGFSLKPRDAYDSAKVIRLIFHENQRWFRKPEPIHYSEIRSRYKLICPDMEVVFPGVVDNITQPEIIRQLGFPVDNQGYVTYPSGW